MNPVGMHEVNRVRHEDLKRANEARRRTLSVTGKRNGLLSTLLARLVAWANRGKRPVGTTLAGKPEIEVPAE